MSKLIALEGCDGVGKTTQVRLAVDALTKMEIPVHTLKFPFYANPIGEVCGRALRGDIKLDWKAFQLLEEADRMQMQGTIRDMLKSADNAIVILDRYVTSGIAYGYAQGIDAKWTTDLQRYLIKPYDILLDMHPSAAIKRKGGEATSVYDSNLIMQQAIREVYRMVIPIGQCIDANLTEGEVHASVMTLILRAPNTQI